MQPPPPHTHTQIQVFPSTFASCSDAKICWPTHFRSKKHSTKCSTALKFSEFVAPSKRGKNSDRLMMTERTFSRKKLNVIIFIIFGGKNLILCPTSGQNFKDTQRLHKLKSRSLQQPFFSDGSMHLEEVFTGQQLVLVQCTISS